MKKLDYQHINNAHPQTMKKLDYQHINNAHPQTMKKLDINISTMLTLKQ